MNISLSVGGVSPRTATINEWGRAERVVAAGHAFITSGTGRRVFCQPIVVESTPIANETTPIAIETTPINWSSSCVGGQ